MIKRVQCYQIGRKFYKTEYAALRHHAFRLIGEKINGTYPPTRDEPFIWLSDVKDYHGVKCCGEVAIQGEIFEPHISTPCANANGWECPLHDRNTGYFARVAARYARMYAPVLKKAQEAGRKEAAEVEA